MSDVLVLCYHALSPTWPAPLSVTPDAFEYQLSYLARKGWVGTTFTRAVSRPCQPRALAVTFDDAFASVRELAGPILSSLGWPATVFVPTAFVSRGRPLSWPGVDHWASTPYAGELRSMTWNDLRELADQGWEIGSHTRTHPRLTSLSDRELQRELRSSKAECSERLGRPCESVAYPYGDVDGRVVAATRDAGFLFGAALGRDLRAAGQWRWPRAGVYHADGPYRFRLKVTTPVRRLRASRLWPAG